MQLSRKKKFFLILIICLVIATILEMGSRFYLRKSQGYSGGPLLQYEFDPYKNVQPTPNFVDTRGLQHNAQGFRRSSPVSRKKPDGTFRIFLMGGSTAYGTGGLWPHIQNKYPILKNTETIDAYLEQDLNRRFPGRKIEVINAAIPSIWTHHHLIYLNQTILKYNPDLVIMLDGYNDFYYYQPGHDQFASYAYQEHSRIIMGEPTLSSLLYVNMWWLGRKSAFVHLAVRKGRVAKAVFVAIGKKIKGGDQRPPIDVDAAIAGLQNTFPNNALKMVERIALLLQNENVPATFVLQPMLIMERNRPGLPEIEQKMLDFNVKSYLPNYETYMSRAVPIVSSLERATVERYGASFLDATRLFAHAKGQIFTDYVHLTPEANQMLSSYIADHVACRIAAQLNPNLKAAHNGEGAAAPAGGGQAACAQPHAR